MAVVTAPTAHDEPRVADDPIAVPRPTPRWGAPIWAADDPITKLDQAPVAELDIITMSIILAYRPE